MMDSTQSQPTLSTAWPKIVFIILILMVWMISMIDFDWFDLDDYHQSSTPVRWQACTRSQSRVSGKTLAATGMIIRIIIIMLVIVRMATWSRRRMARVELILRKEVA